MLPARISASSRRLTLLTAGAALALTTACGGSSSEDEPLTVPSAQQTATVSASATSTASASPTATGPSPADIAESAEAEPADAEPQQTPEQQDHVETPAEGPAPGHQLEETGGETGARQDTEQTITDTDEQPAFAHPATETQQSTGEVQELDDEGSVFYETCEAAAAEGIFNILEGTAGYRIELDEDGNGIACEG